MERRLTCLMQRHRGEIRLKQLLRAYNAAAQDWQDTGSPQSHRTALALLAQIRERLLAALEAR